MALTTIFLGDLLMQTNQISQSVCKNFRKNPVFILTIAGDKVIAVPFTEEIDNFVRKHYEIYPYSRFTFLLPKKYLQTIYGNVIVLEKRFFIFKRRYEVILEW